MGRKYSTRFSPFPRKIFTRSMTTGQIRGNGSISAPTTPVGPRHSIVLPGSSSTMVHQRSPGVPRENLLEKLPKELILAVYMHMTIEDLGTLAQTDKTSADRLLAFVLSSDFSRKMAAELMSSPDMSMREIYERVGVLLKRVTSIMPTAKRLKVAEEFYALNGPPDLVSNRAIANCWGALIKKFVNGWAFGECERVFRTVCTFSRDELNSLVHVFLASEPGSNPVVESRLRTFYRSVFLDPHNDDSETSPRLFDADFGFYLDMILRDHSLYQQAKLLYLLYGPDSEGFMQWTVMTDLEFNSPHMYTQIGQAITSLARNGDEKRNRPVQELISLVEEVTSYPDNWTLHNFANLLDRVSENVTYMLLSSRVINNRLREACDLIYLLVQISCNRGQSLERRMRLLMAIMDQLKTKQARELFIREFNSSFFGPIRTNLLSVHAPQMAWSPVLACRESFLLDVFRLAFFPSSTPMDQSSE